VGSAAAGEVRVAFGTGLDDEARRGRWRTRRSAMRDWGFRGQVVGGGFAPAFIGARRVRRAGRL
jgi:hypothetical protein